MVFLCMALFYHTPRARVKTEREPLAPPAPRSAREGCVRKQLLTCFRMVASNRSAQHISYFGARGATALDSPPGKWGGVLARVRVGIIATFRYCAEETFLFFQRQAGTLREVTAELRHPDFIQSLKVFDK